MGVVRSNVGPRVRGLRMGRARLWGSHHVGRASFLEGFNVLVMAIAGFGSLWAILFPILRIVNRLTPGVAK